MEGFIALGAHFFRMTKHAVPKEEQIYNLLHFPFCLGS